MTSGRAFNHLNYFFKMYFQSATRKASVSSKQISLIFFGPECLCSKAIFQEMTNSSLLKLFIVAWCLSETQQKGKLRDFKEIIASFSQKHFSRSLESHWRCMCAQCNGRSILINTELAAHLRRPGHQAGPTELPDCSLPSAPPLLPSAPHPAASRLAPAHRMLPAQVGAAVLAERCCWWTLRRLNLKGL